ncbi:MAG: penicillin amidase [Rhodothermales bacterium]|jgi:penicillin amidase
MRCLLPALLCFLALPISAQTVQVSGLDQPVEIIRDPWGINHIYAETEHDLFFAQGYAAAKDRLFQFEIWRRQTTGTVSELLGRRELRRDIGTRLFRFRGDMEDEMNYYHPRGAEIITAFVDGVNAYIAETHADPSLLPLEFRLLDTRPEFWTVRDVISRHQGLLGNIGDELNYGRAVAALGATEVLEHTNFQPGTPDIEMDGIIDGDALSADILGIYNAYRRPVRFRPEDLAAEYRGSEEAFEDLVKAIPNVMPLEEREAIGSNNWVVAGERTASGYPIMANDPHRTHAAPSLRYWVHLNGPGWNVIGGGEPEIPGISIGHNEHGAWGLTVFQTDGEDLYVYETNPKNPNEYWYGSGWESMSVIADTFMVRGEEPVIVEHRYTRHGPVTFQEGSTAYAVRAAWLEIGGAPYLASLRMDQATTWEEFREACEYSHIPGENMIWAGRDGTIGWQAVGIAPVRPNWSGLVPVPGDGRFEWDGYLPIRQKPHRIDPPEGFIATANNNLVPKGYAYRDAVGWDWSDPSRFNRLEDVLSSGRAHTMPDMMALQTDYLSAPAQAIVPLLKHLRPGTTDAAEALEMLADWDHRLTPDSGPAAVYVALERRLQRAVPLIVMSEEAQEALGGLPMSMIIDHLVRPGPEFADLCEECTPLDGRDELLVTELAAALEWLLATLGPDLKAWQYGQYKHVSIPHPMSAAVNPETRAKLDVGTLPRGGNSFTVNNSGSGDNQRSGASFRMIVDTSDWDASVGMNAPGQSGRPDSPHYRDLFQRWAQDQFFPVYFSREKVEAAAVGRSMLLPKD